MAVNARAAWDAAPSDRTLLKELSVYRGLSESLIGATRHAVALDWGRLARHLALPRLVIVSFVGIYMVPIGTFLIRI